MAEEKILENEKLDEEQLDNVAGGNANEFYEDVERFKKLNVHLEGEHLAGTPSKDVFTASVIMAFKKYGVKYVHSWSNGNQYYVNGKKVSQDEAWKHIESQFKK